MELEISTEELGICLMINKNSCTSEHISMLMSLTKRAEQYALESEDVFIDVSQLDVSINDKISQLSILNNEEQIFTDIDELSILTQFENYMKSLSESCKQNTIDKYRNVLKKMFTWFRTVYNISISKM